MMKENFFIDILGLQGHKRMGKTCAPKILCFLRHPNVHPGSRITDPTFPSLIPDLGLTRFRIRICIKEF